eukprot:TRINITY_DN521_c0_g1_i2.p1 TRINITY_DN521_c0_g1~~TRINITY_DN521_c0_g1_i2.p1  ORF type:complete len:371 (+),score=112.67 TRINITY_DN521_c0_g1_i2:131-1243(+)
MECVVATTKVKATEGRFMWRIENYSAAAARTDQPNFIKSPTFSIDGRTWCIQWYPKGNAESSKDSVSWYVVFPNRTETLHLSYEFRVKHETRAPDGVCTLSPGSMDGCRDFLLQNELRMLLENDTLEMVIDMKLYGSAFEHMADAPRGSNDSTSSLPSDLGRLLLLTPESMPHEASDVTFTFASNPDVVVHAHKLILSARSAVFRSMLGNGMRETASGRVLLEDADPTHFRELMQWVYTGKCNDDTFETSAAEMLALADRFDLQDLRDKCERLLLQGMTIHNAGSMLMLADTYQCKQLRADAIQFIARRFLEVFATPDFKAMSMTSPNLFSEVHGAVTPLLGGSTSVSTSFPSSSTSDLDIGPRMKRPRR